MVLNNCLKPISLIFTGIFYLILAGYANASLQVKLANHSLIVEKDHKKIAVITDIMLDFESIDQIELLSRNDKTTRFKLTYFDVVVDQAVEKSADRTVILHVQQTDRGLHFTTDADWFDNVNLLLEDLGGHMFGVKQTLEPYNQKSPDLRGLIQDVNAIGEENRLRTNYATAVSPVFFNSNGYLSFFNTFSEGRYQFAINGKTELYHASNNLDWYLFYAETLDSALTQYYRVIGNPKSVPVWGTGPVFWRDAHLNGSEDLLSDAQKFDALRMPYTAMFIDRPYSDGAHRWASMNFNQKFSDPHRWIAELNQQHNVKIMTWIAPMTFAETKFPGRFAGKAGYFDLTNPETLVEFKKRLNTFQYPVGIQGHKMDRADEYFPVNESWYDKTRRQDRRSKFIWLYGKTTHDMLSEAWQEDHFNFARSAVHGSQQHVSAIWAGDVMTNWKGLQNNMANAVRASFQGFPNWGTDVGGYIGKTGRISEDLYLRWMQFGLWTGFFEIKIDGAAGEGEDRPPWAYSQKFQKLYRAVLEERMQLMPYIHSLLNTAANTGTLMKPLAGLYPEDAQTYDIWDQYFFGPSLMIAPVYNTQHSRKVYLPEGKWFDYYTAQPFQGGRYIEVKTLEATVPVFAKANSLILTGNIYQGNDKNWRKNPQMIALKIFVDETKSMNDSFEFVDGNNGNKRYLIDAEINNQILRLNLNSLPYAGELSIYSQKGLKSLTFSAGQKSPISVKL